jgi:predicted ATPase
VGREVEVAALERFGARIHHGSAAVLMRGEPGIGKTTLWRHALAAAEACGVLVLASRCVEAEMPIAMCGLADLLEPVLGDVLGVLPPSQREALSGALWLEPDCRSSADRIALPRAVTATLRALTDRAPVLVALDDVQWLDPASGRLVAFALRRLVDRRLGALITVRGGAGEPDPLALERWFGRERFDELRLGPPSTGALGHLVRSSLNVHVPRPTLKRIHQVSGGNPMYALELVRGLAERGEIGPLAHVPLPASLDELLRARVDRFPAEIRALLETVAAPERPTPAFLARAIDDAAALLDVAITAEALVDDDGVLRFAHPLLASAVYARVPPARRRQLHRRRTGLTNDMEERARHLALAAEGPDHEIAEALE